MKRTLVVGAVVAAALLIQCKNPFDVPSLDTSAGQPFKITATINGVSFSAGGTCAVQSSPDGELMTVTATEVGATGAIKTLTLNLLAPIGATAPFSQSFTTTSSVAAFTDGQNTDNTYSTENAGSGSISFTHWESNNSGTGWAEGTFSFIGKKPDGSTATITGGNIKKN